MASVFSAGVLVKRFISVLLMLSGLLVAGGANAAVDIRFANSGNNVAVTISGTVDPSGLTPGDIETHSYAVLFIPASAYFYSKVPCRVYDGISGPGRWGSSYYASVSSTTGGGFGINGSGGQLCLPVGYVALQELAGTATISNQSVGSLGLTPGVYTYTWGVDTLTVTIVPPAPTVSSISPTSGSIAGGDRITITGTDLTGATGITVGGNACTTYNVSSATSATCVTPAGSAGTASVVVTTPAGSNAANTLFTYTLAPQATLSVTSNPTSIYVNGTSAISASGGSGSGAVTYNLVSGPCTLSGVTLTGTGAGDCIVTATKAADSTYASATSSQVTVAVSLATQATLVATSNPTSINVNGTSTLSTTGGSGSGAVTYSLVSGPCTLNGATLTGTGAGSCIVTATKAADSTYASATSSQVTVVIPAPVDCVVSSWSAYGACSASCGGGTQTQTRTVTTPAANGGAACPALSQSQACNTQACQSQAPVTTPGGTVNAGITGGSFVTTQAATPTNPPVGQSFPYGVFGFTAATNTLGGSITITLTYPQALAAGSQIWKNINGTWLDYTSNVTFNQSRTTITYTIVDGGPFDSDGVVNQSVTDPIGPATSPTPSPQPIPTLSEWGQIMMMFLMIVTVGWYGRRLKQR